MHLCTYTRHNCITDTVPCPYPTPTAPLLHLVYFTYAQLRCTRLLRCSCCAHLRLGSRVASSVAPTTKPIPTRIAPLYSTTIAVVLSNRLHCQFHCQYHSHDQYYDFSVITTAVRITIRTIPVPVTFQSLLILHLPRMVGNSTSSLPSFPRAS